MHLLLCIVIHRHQPTRTHVIVIIAGIVIVMTHVLVSVILVIGAVSILIEVVVITLRIVFVIVTAIVIFIVVVVAPGAQDLPSLMFAGALPPMPTPFGAPHEARGLAVEPRHGRSRCSPLDVPGTSHRRHGPVTCAADLGRGSRMCVLPGACPLHGLAR